MTFGSSKGSSRSTTNQTSSQTSTPNNLDYLRKGWGAASDILGGNNAQASAALDLLHKGASAAGGAARGGLTTATGLANGGTANPANVHLTPFADGSMTGANNPFFANLAQQISRTVQGATDGDFAASGRYGSGANANAFNSAVANQVGQLGYADYKDSLDRQLQAGGQLSANNANSVNQALAALGVIPALGSAATGAGKDAFQGATAPLTNFANVIGLFGPGGGTVNSQGNGTTTGKQSGSSFSFNPLEVLKGFGL